MLTPASRAAINERSRTSPAGARLKFRAGASAPTTGWSAGYTQANMISVPADWAYDFLLFCQRNPQPCPVLDVTDRGSYTTVLATECDLRTDLPKYRVWEDGIMVDEPSHVVDHWRNDMVTFLIGCSFSFETLLQINGIPLRHVDQLKNVGMFVTDRECRPAGRISGRMVVSMRYVPESLVERAVQITRLMPAVHGAPVHVGDPAALGISDINNPPFGDSIDPEPGDIPVFWACGVTPQSAVMSSKPPFAITHSPGFMLVTDRPDSDYRITAE